MRTWLLRAVALLGLLLVAATLLPLVPSNAWWIRFFDFPRAQIAVLLFLLIAVALAVKMWSRRWGKLLLAALLLSLGYQVSRILPYVSPWTAELSSAASCPPGDSVSYMEANVLQSNRNAAALVGLVKDRRPDILLLTETDQWWADRLRSLSGDMPHVVSAPLANTYGMILLSRRPLLEPQVRYLIERDIPSIRTAVMLDSGQRIDLYAVHPRPPLPGDDTGERDAEIVLVGREVRARRMPAIVAGDLNDVAWSDSTALFQEVSGLLDPRVGRRLMPTFPAKFPWLRWPLDYIFVSPGFTLLRLERLGDIGSDHLPIVVYLCATGISRQALPPPRLDAETKEDVRETVQEGKEEAAGR